MSDADERRQHQRIELKGATVEVPLSIGSARFAILNVSGGGALIAGRIDAEPGAEIVLIVHVPDFAAIPVPVRILRHVQHRGGEHTAVMFRAQSDILAQWIKEVSPEDP
jgi:hypothetical protein